MKKEERSFNSTLRKKSDKQKVKNAIWKDVTFERCEYIIDKYGYLLCEWCSKNVNAHIIKRADGHHIDKNRNNNTRENCYIAVGECHSHITDNNILVKYDDLSIFY